MKSIYKIQALACGAALFALTACTDVWEEHYQPQPSLNADQTLWDLIDEDPDLTDFKEYLIATKCDSLLMMNRNYTVWAPVNGSKCFEGVAQLEDPDMIEVYRTEIVENHIADFSHVATGIRDKEDKKNYKKVPMLNGKSYHFEGSPKDDGYKFAEVSLRKSNIMAKNGVLHKLEGSVDYASNLWEQIGKEAELESLWKFLSKDYKKILDEGKTIYGPIVAGQQTILEAVWTEECRWFNELAALNEEDSSYTVYALNNDAWKDMYDMTSAYFNYASNLTSELNSTQKSAEIKDSVVKELMCQNLFFSDAENKMFFEGKKDTLVSTYRRRWPRILFKGDEAHAITHNGIKKTLKLSNGELNIVDQVNYNPLTCWHDTIRIQGESLNSVERYPDATADNDADGMGYDSKYLYKNDWTVRIDSTLYDSISGGRVGYYEANEGTKDQPYFNFYVDNVLSANYRVKLVLFPTLMVDPEASLVKPNKFTVELAYANAQGEPKKVYFDPIEERSTHKKKEGGKDIKQFKSNPTQIDTILIADCFEFPACEANLNSINSTVKSIARLKIKTAITFSGTGLFATGENKGDDRTKWNWDNSYRIDEVIFEPLPADYESPYERNY